LIVGIPCETTSGESRVALVPESVKKLVDRGLDVLVESGCGEAAGHPDAQYTDAGARVAQTAAEVLGSAGLVLKVAPPTPDEIGAMAEGAAFIGFLKPLDSPELAEHFARRKVDAFSIELMPRITRAQSMDALSSQSTIAGYQAVLLSAIALPRIFPMLVTAAGTLQPAKVLVIGAGVAGLQALGTAKRLGAVTSAYDTRPVVKEQVESIGGRFVELDLEVEGAEDAGGYATAQDEAFYQRQREQLGKHVAASDVVISTALVPGQPAPLLIEEAAVEQMRPGSVIVDLAAEKGGNCACTQPDTEAQVHGVTILGHTNLPGQVPAHASQMYAKNLLTFLDHLLDEENNLTIDREDEITAGTLVTHQGEIVNDTVRERLPGGGS
jgi:NAD(P) transhydrogenase subunit alpha